MSSSLFSRSKRHNSSKEVFSCLKLLVVMHIRVKLRFLRSQAKNASPPENSSFFLILISRHFEFGTAEIASHILWASSDKVNILVAPCRLLASHTYARTRGRVGDTLRSTSSKNVLKANTCILRRLGYPPPLNSPSRFSLFPAFYVFRHSGEDTFAKPHSSMFYFLL